MGSAPVCSGGFVSTIYSYYRLEFKLLREMLGACPEASMYEQHIIQKAKKSIAAANRQTKKLEKFVGVEISDEKALKEIQGIIRAFEELVGSKEEMPTTKDGCLEYAQKLNEQFEDLVQKGEQQRATVFMRTPEGKPMLSSHIILGNFKENLKTLVNAGDKSIAKSKVQVGELGSLALKVVEEFIVPDQDIVRDSDGKRILCERPILFEVMGKKETAIALSEKLPEGTQFNCTLRVVNGLLGAKPEDAMENIARQFELGKNNGFGQWRGSGNKGAFVFKIKHLPDYKEDFGEWR